MRCVYVVLHPASLASHRSVYYVTALVDIEENSLCGVRQAYSLPPATELCNF